MRCLVCGSREAERWQMLLENEGDAWSVTCVHDASEAARRLRAEPFDVLILGDTPGTRSFCAQLTERGCIPAPYLAVEAGMPVRCDVQFNAQQAAELAGRLIAYRNAARLPVCSLSALEPVTCLAKALLHALGVRPGLRAMRFLPDMLALCVLQPSLLQELSLRLYPLIARRHGMTPASVERSLRLLVESTWSRVPLSALERFFGHSVDPERGKPTNREFLAQLQQRLTLAARRWQGG